MILAATISTWAAISKHHLNEPHSPRSTPLVQDPQDATRSEGFAMFYSYRHRRTALRMTLTLAAFAALIVLLGLPTQF
jgi:hypothetical protein